MPEIMEAKSVERSRRAPPFELSLTKTSRRLKGRPSGFSTRTLRGFPCERPPCRSPALLRPSRVNPSMFTSREYVMVWFTARVELSALQQPGYSGYSVTVERDRPMARRRLAPCDVH